MPRRVPIDLLQQHGYQRGFTLDDDEAARLREQIGDNLEYISKLDHIDVVSTAPPQRDSRRVDQNEDYHNAFLTKCDIQRRDTGPLAGYEIGVKDNIAVAGVPMTCGSPLLEEYIPHHDATVIERLLDAGGRIVGKTNMDEFALGADETTMRFKVTPNPHDADRHPGGSSLGSGVAVAEKVVDIALGTDTGGSVRLPASWSGVIGLKPTRDVVPIDGFVQYGKTLDTIGLLATNVVDAARGFGVMANDAPDGLVAAIPETKRERETAVQNLTIGVTEELFGEHAAIDEVVDGAIDNLADRGASIVDVSIPRLEYATPAWLAIGATEFGAYLDTRSISYWAESGYSFPLFKSLQQGLGEKADELGTPIRDVWLQAAVMQEVFGNQYYGKAQKARELLTEDVQHALSDVDVLASPTIPMMPPRLDEGFGDVATVVGNTGPFNLTGHPAISVEAGYIENLPVGIQFVSSKYAEDRLFRAAACLNS